MTQQKSRTTPSRLHHIDLKTTRLREMVDWYVQVLAAEALLELRGGAYLANEEANHRLALLSPTETSDDPDKVARTGTGHSVFEHGSIDRLLDAYARLKDEGIEPYATLNRGVTTSFYYVDPDGNSVELRYDRLGTRKESKEWMGTKPQMVRNPIGVPVVPEAMIGARKAAASDW